MSLLSSSFFLFFSFFFFFFFFFFVLFLFFFFFAFHFFFCVFLNLLLLRFQVCIVVAGKTFGFCLGGCAWAGASASANAHAHADETKAHVVVEFECRCKSSFVVCARLVLSFCFTSSFSLSGDCLTLLFLCVDFLPELGVVNFNFSRRFS